MPFEWPRSLLKGNDLDQIYLGENWGKKLDKFLEGVNTLCRKCRGGES